MSINEPKRFQNDDYPATPNHLKDAKNPMDDKNTYHSPGYYPSEGESSQTLNQKPKKKGRFLQNFFFSFLGLILLFALLIFPFASQSVLAMALDAGGLHKEAMFVDVLTKKAIPLATNAQANGNVGTYISSISTLDVSKPESCRQVWSVNNLNLNSYSEFGSDNYAQFQTTGKYQDWLKADAFSSSQISSNQAYFDLNFKGQLDLQVDKLAQKQKEIQKEDSLRNEDLERLNRAGTVTAALNFQGVSTLDKFYYAVEKISLGANNFDLGFNFKYADQNYLGEKEKQGAGKILEGLNEVLKINSKDLFSPSAGQDLMEIYCQRISSIKVLSPINKDFGTGQNKTTKNVRPIEIQFKEKLSNTEKTKAKALLRNIVLDNQLKSSIKSKYEGFKKIYDGQKQLLPQPTNEDKKNLENPESIAANEAKVKAQFVSSSLEKTWQDNSLNKLNFANQTNDKLAQNDSNIKYCAGDNCLASDPNNLDLVFSSKAEFEKYIDKQFEEIKSSDNSSNNSSFLRDLESFLGLNEDSLVNDNDTEIKSKNTFYLDMNNQNFFGSEYFVEAKSKKSGNGNLLEEIAQEPIKFIFQSYNQKVSGEVKPNSIPEKVR